MLTLALLGQVKISRDGQAIPGFHSQTGKALLIYLAHTGQTHSRETVADLLWDARSTKQSLSNLRTALTRLKAIIGEELIVTRQTLAFLPSARLNVDSVRLQTECAAIGVPQSPAEAIRLAAALSLYKGGFLTGFYLPDAPRFNEWVAVEQENLRQQLFVGFQRLITYAVEAVDLPLGIEAAQHWLAVDAFNETAHTQLIHLLALNGQTPAALTQYERLSSILAEEFGTVPQPATAVLVERIRQGNVAAITPLAVPTRITIPHNLPRELTPFIGRAAERSTLAETLRDSAYPLVTLTGEGGAGKTRLALTAVGDLLANGAAIFPDGIWWISLATIEGRGSVREAMATAVAHALGIIFHGERLPSAQLLAVIRPKACLLVLDNFEHLLESDAVELLIELLHEGQHLHLLVTSITPLALNSEFVVRLTGLAVPPTTPDEGNLADYDSVHLFAERAARTASDFQIADCLMDVADICRYLAGMPLGIQLAAAWVHQMSCAEIASAIRSNLDFLAVRQRDMPPRQQSMRAVFAYAWQLLDEASRRTLAQAALFRGGFTREAIGVVMGDEGAALDSLVEHSLLEQGADGRYTLHELLRQFAAEKLAEWEANLPNPPYTQERHSRYYLEMVGRVTLIGAKAKPSLLAADGELDNIREAWRWAVSAACVPVMAIGWQGLWTFYGRRALFQEGEAAFRMALEAIQSVASSEPAHQLMAVQLKLARASFLNILTRYEEAKTVAQEVIAFAQTVTAVSLLAQAHLVWGTAHYRQGQFDEALAQLAQGLVLAQASGKVAVEADVRRRMGTSHLEKGEFDLARQQLEQALSLYRQIGHRLGEGELLGDLGWLEQRALHLEAALAYLIPALHIHREIDNRQGISMALINLSVVYSMAVDFEQAYHCQREALHILEDMDDRYHKSLLNHNLGVQLSRVGDYAAAREHYERSMAIDRESGGLAGVAWSQNNLGLLYNHLGEFETALALHQESLATARKLGARTIEGLALLRMGQDLQGLGQLEASQAAFQAAREIQQELGQMVWAMEASAGLARTCLEMEQVAEALALVDEVLLYLADHSLDGARERHLVLWNCYVVLAGGHDPRAAGMLAEVYQRLQAQAATIGSERVRLSFLENVRTNRLIVQTVGEVV